MEYSRFHGFSKLRTFRDGWQESNPVHLRYCGAAGHARPRSGILDTAACGEGEEE
jgi:hypothetical protein